MSQSTSELAVSAPNAAYAKVWIVHASTDAAWSIALAEHLSNAGHKARAVGISDAIRHIAWDRVGGGIEGLRKLLPSMSGDDQTSVMDELSSRPPRVVITRSADSGRAFSRLRTLIGAKFSILALVNDFEPTSAWKNSLPELLIAPTRAQITPLGLDADDTTRVGIAGPLAPFESPSANAKKIARAAMKLDEDQCAVLVDGSAMRTSDIPHVVSQLAQLGEQDSALRWLFYYGEHAENGAAMRAAARTHRVSALMFSHTTPLPRVLPGIDRVITAARGDARVGCAYLKIPMLAYGDDLQDHPLVQLGVMAAVPDVHAVASAFLEIQNDASRLNVQEQRPTAFVQSAVFDAVEHLVRQNIEERDTSATTSSEAPTDLHFEEIGEPARAIDPEDEVFASTKAPLNPRKAREEMTRLLMELRRLEQTHTDAVQGRDEWMERLQDAEEAGELDLRNFAEERARKEMEKVAQLQQAIARVQDARNSLRKQQAGKQTPTVAANETASDVPPEMEARFQALADQRRLRELRQRAGKKDPRT